MFSMFVEQMTSFRQSSNIGWIFPYEGATFGIILPKIMPVCKIASLAIVYKPIVLSCVTAQKYLNLALLLQ